MNLHVPQSIVTEHELRAIAAVPFQIMSPKECKPLVAVVQDVALGIYRLTKKHVTLSEKQMFNLMSTNSKFFGSIPEPATGGLQKAWSGKQALSAIMPPTVNLRSGNNSYDDTINDKDNFVIIENGEIKQGTIDKKIYQNRTKGLIHSIYNDCNEEETRHFFDNTQKLICNWLVQSGFSVGISDLIVDSETQQSLKQIIHDMKVQVYDIIKNIHMSKFENNTITNNHDYFESEINKILNKAREQTGKKGLSKINDMENRLINMIKSGSKGSVINVAQMIACVGQQNVDGKRIPYGFDSRTLPHYVKYDDGPDSRGFVENSFISGLSPQEFFFHSMGGREGLIDTAVKSVTADTEIIIIENGKCKSTCIGPWIDGILAKNKIRVQYKEEKHTELLELQDEVYIPNMDSKGNMQWSKMKYVTRHDPDNELYQVTTKGGRTVTVTQYDSMLVWDAKKKEFLPLPTTDIKVGDFVPITTSMPSPPQMIHHVNMSDYLPKAEFLYGSDFYVAKGIVESAMTNKDKIPVGWWHENNGKTFELPYPKKSRFQRVLKRSDVDAIKAGYVYNYAASRGECSIPEVMPLDFEFGRFIGLYLAEGYVHTPSGKISIANNDVTVRAHMKAFFDKYNIKSKEYHKTASIKNGHGDIVSQGNTSCIQGYSTVLGKFLDKFVGHGAQGKYVPQEAFAAPLEFVQGVLGGYLAGDGYVGRTCIEASSASKQLIEGIAMLCSRLGAFAKLSQVQLKKNNVDTKNIQPSYRLSIRSCFADRLRSQLDLIVPYKNERLKAMQCTAVHSNFHEFNDVVMDSVVDVKKIDVLPNQKVYDVTVPDTYNFAIKNGLNLRDTADTGYLQRKLIKAMEDCKISFDYTVRNANGSIVQFLYGEDGVDPIKIESQSLPYIDMDYAKLKSEYLLTKHDDLEGICAHVKSIDETAFKQHFDQVVSDREYMIINIFKRRQSNSFMYPVSLTRIIANAKATMVRYGVDKTTSDLDPQYALDTINSLADELFVSPYNKGNKFIQVLIRAYLSPKQVVLKYRFTKDVFDHVIQQVRHRFFDSIAHPSEMVGVIAAQSIGEPATQMTLNTFHHSGISSASKAVRGVPRIKELLSVTKNMKGPAMTIHLQEDIKQDKMKSNSVLKSIQTTYFKDLVKSSKIYYDASDFSTGIEEDRTFVDTYKELMELDLVKRYDNAPWLLRFEINRDKLLEEGLTMIQLYNILQDYYDDTISCMFSDDNSGNLIFRIRLIEDNSEDRDYITELKALEKNIMDNIIIKGVKSINKAMMNKQEYMIYNDETMQFDKTAEWVLDTSGTNMVDVMCHHGVDYTKTVSNDINEIYDLLGIEAARGALYNELSGVIADAELYVNYRHIALLVDTMTNRGYLLSVDRHGINRVDIGPLAKCSFEETTDMLIKAGIFSEVDKITGVSANIMLGQIPPCGTGDTDILIDEHKLMNLLDETEDHEEQDDSVDADMCTMDHLSFDFSMPAANPQEVVQVNDFDIKVV